MSSIAFGTQVTAPRLRITPRGRAVLAALIAAPLLAAAWFGLGAPAAQAGGDSIANTYTYVSVEPGQSLWQLAELIAPQADPREVVSGIMTLNNLPSADVQPGQELAIPASFLP